MTRRQASWGRKLALLAGALLFGLLLLEGAVRLRSWLRYGTASDIYDLYQKHPTTGHLMPIPNLSILYARTKQIDIDGRGFRSPELEVPKPAGTVRLAFLGGSTTFCAEVSSNEHTWPHRVTEMLRRRLPKVRFDYLNAGVTGARIQHSILNLRHRIKQLQPDVVIVYHATNDLAMDTRAVAEEKGLIAKPSPKGWLERNSLLCELVLKNLRWLRAQRRGRAATNKLEYDPREISGGFRQRLTELVRASQEIAPVVALATFSIKTRRWQSEAEQLENLQQSFTFMPFLTPEGTLRGYEEYNRVIREVAAATGAVLLDTGDSIPGDAAHFFDSVHFTDRGAEAMAELVVTRLVQAPDFKQLVDARRAAGPRK